MQRSILFALASSFALAAGALAPAAAAERQVSYSDLDLSSREGADAALSRIRHAARDECDFNDQRIVPIKQYTRIRACMADYSARAIEASGNSNLQERYAERTRLWSWAH